MTRILNQTWIIADTNYFLHFQQPDQIDWNTLVSSKQINLVVPMTVIDELDKHKNAPSSKLRSRAKAVIAKLKDIRRTDEKLWGENVRLEIAPSVPLPDMVELGLDESRPDDRIIAFTVSFIKTKNTESSQIFLISNDFGMELKSEGRGIQLLILPENLLIAAEPDPNEKELRELRKQNFALTSRIPKLAVTINESGDRFEATLTKVQTLTDDEIESKVAEVKRLNPPHAESPVIIKDQEEGKGSPNGMDLHKIIATLSAMQGAVRPSKEQWDKYNSELEEFYEKYRNYLNQDQSHQELVARSIFLDLYIENGGTTPASDVRVNLHFPDGFQLIEYGDFPEEPQKPMAPQEPRANSLIEMLSMSNLMQPRPLLGLNTFERNLEQPNVSGFSIKPTNSFEVNFNVRKVMHGDPTFLRSLVVIFDSAEDAHSFTVDSKIICDELTEASYRKLHVIVKH